MDYTQKSKHKDVFPGKAVFRAEDYSEINKDEFLADLGTDPQDIYDNLTCSIGDLVGFYLPKFQYCHSEYLSGVALGLQPHLLLNQKRIVTRPGNKFFNFKYLREEIQKYKDVLAYLPQRWHRSGDKKDTLIIEDISWVYTVFASVKPIEFDSWFTKQSKLHKDCLEKHNPKKIRVPSKLLEKLKLMEKRNYRRGKTGPMIVNKAQNKNIKRKREECVYQEVKKKEVDDKVWFPPQNLQEGYQPAVDQSFVVSQEYTTLNDKYKELERLTAKYIEYTIKTPWILAMSMEDPNHRISAYNKCAEATRISLSATNVKVPTWEEASKEYGNSN